MSRKRTLAAFLLSALLAGPAARGFADGPVAPAPKSPGSAPGTDAEPAPQKLSFVFPCRITETGGKDYVNPATDRPVESWECDYMHASIKNNEQNAAQYFNSLPTIAAQKAFLAQAVEDADAAFNAYNKKVVELVAKTDPSKLPKTLTKVQRLNAIAALDVQLSTGVFAAAAPFLWPPRESESYVQKGAGSWPKTWTPYIKPIYDRSGQLQGLVHDSEMTMIDQASADLEKKLSANALTKAAEAVKKAAGGADGAAALDGMFDGGPTHGAVAPAPAPGPDAEPKGANVVNAVPLAITDLKASPPPIPVSEADRDQRNYFARGTSAGLSRLIDDKTIALWHAMGQTSTVGDPYGKAGLIFHQEGPSCDVSAEAEALHARGVDVPVNKLAQEGLDKGYYVDYPTSGGGRDGGSPWQTVNQLLTDHGVKNTVVSNATPAQLDRALRSTGDAITYVKVKTFWNIPNVPDSATHAIYVTGEEVDTSGKVRGYYVNDTGTGEAARYVSADLFDKVWLKKIVTFQK